MTKVTLISEAQMKDYIERWSNGEPIIKDIFYAKFSDDNRYVGMDNTSGCCWVEDFDNEKECIEWCEKPWRN